MVYKKNDIWSVLDWWIVGLYLLFVLMGWFCIYATTYGFDNCNTSHRDMLQIIWIVSSFGIGFILLNIKTEWYEMVAFVAYAAMILLLGFTIFVANPIKGSKSWLVFGPLRIQPAEFAKVTTALAVSKAMKLLQFSKLKRGKIINLIVLILLPSLLIFLQKETGSALVFFVFFFVFFLEGMQGKVLFIGCYSILLFILVVRYSNSFFGMLPIGKLCGFTCIPFFIVVYLWFFGSIKERKRAIYLSYWTLFITIVSILVGGLFSYSLYWIVLPFIVGIMLSFLCLFIRERKTIHLLVCFFVSYSCAFMFSTDFILNNILESYQKTRIQVSFGLIDDLRGVGYNINQSKIAIGSGKLIGKGYLKGTQTMLKYVPEQETDFIFCTLGEEKGFIGSIVVIILFVVFIIRLILLSTRQKNIFSRTYGYCVACIFFFHFTINVGMVLGMIPVVGIPLPFFSYGGSSLWTFTILLFIFVKLDATRKLFYRNRL